MKEEVGEATVPCMWRWGPGSSDSQPGYVEGSYATIAACSVCKVSFAEPQQLDPSLHHRIYQQASEVPGYARYAAYAERVLHCPDPLGELANSEEMYWAGKVKSYWGAGFLLKRASLMWGVASGI